MKLTITYNTKQPGTLTLGEARRNMLAGWYLRLHPSGHVYRVDHNGEIVAMCPTAVVQASADNDILDGILVRPIPSNQVHIAITIGGEGEA